MKQFFYALITISLFSCDQITDKSEKEIKVTVVDSRREQLSDNDSIVPITIREYEDEKEGVVLTEQQLDDIKSFRPYIQDIVWFFYVYPERLELKGCCKMGSSRFQLWIANGYSHFRIEHPGGLDLNEREKQYLWRLYKQWRNKRVRLYDWENKNLQ